ncbi:hypothetical protein LY78DRAFT_657029 [Colletotrichum sublineola]|nr:hypothetical protein LY78DRAFT_657029 [Colletotrichum sublineola]
MGPLTGHFWGLVTTGLPMSGGGGLWVGNECLTWFRNQSLKETEEGPVSVCWRLCGQIRSAVSTLPSDLNRIRRGFLQLLTSELALAMSLVNMLDNAPVRNGQRR